MKKLMFAVIACAMALSGCSSEDNCTTVNPQPEENATEIKLNAGILGVATRAPVSTSDCLPLVVHLQPPADAIAVQVRIRHGISRIGRQRDQPRNQTTEGTCHVGPEYSRHDVHYQRSYAFGNLSHHNGRGNGKQLSDGEKR